MVDSACILLILISIVLLVPLATRSLAIVLEKLYGLSFGNIGILAAKNLRDNRSILHNIALIAIGISSLFMINTISGSVMNSLANMYRDAKFDIQVWAWPSDRNLELKIRTVPGVSETYGLYGVYDVKLPNLDDSIDLGREGPHLLVVEQGSVAGVLFRCGHPDQRLFLTFGPTTHGH